MMQAPKLSPQRGRTNLTGFEVNVIANRMIAALILLAALLLPGCRREGNDPAVRTGTIAPATPRTTTTDTDLDSAMTQTVEIGEDRSPNEGATLTDTENEEEPPTSTATAPPPRP